MKQARGRRPGSHQQIKCGICLHPERGRIDFLVCSGAGVQPTAKKFGVSYDSHVAKQIVYPQIRGPIVLYRVFLIRSISNDHRHELVQVVKSL
jgi:hypothetical protein